MTNIQTAIDDSNVVAISTAIMVPLIVTTVSRGGILAMSTAGGASAGAAATRFTAASHFSKGF